MKKHKIYWVCQECGEEARQRTMKSGVKHCGRAKLSTWHVGKCDVCGETKPVTEPRDFGHSVFDNKKGKV